MPFYAVIGPCCFWYSMVVLFKKVLLQCCFCGIVTVSNNVLIVMVDYLRRL